MIIPEESFLRRLPTALEPESRIRLDAIVYAADTVNWAYNALKSSAAAVGDEPVTSAQFAAVFGAAWTIVLQIDALRQLIGSLTPRGQEPHPTTVALQERAKVAQRMRNVMSHLDQRVKTLAKRKGAQNPLLGALSYAQIRPEDVVQTETGQEIRSLCVRTLCAGAMVGEQTMPILNPIGKPLEIPVCLFQLAAFDEQLALSDTVASLIDWIAAATPRLEEAIQRGATVAAETPGAPAREELLAHPGGGVSIALSMTLGSQKENEGDLASALGEG